MFDVDCPSESSLFFEVDEISTCPKPGHVVGGGKYSVSVRISSDTDVRREVQSQGIWDRRTDRSLPGERTREGRVWLCLGVRRMGMERRTSRVGEQPAQSQGVAWEEHA